jgi:hypothetical protein
LCLLRLFVATAFSCAFLWQKVIDNLRRDGRI